MEQLMAEPESEIPDSRGDQATKRYVYALGTSPTSVTAGLSLHAFGTFQHKALEILYVNVRQGHDTFLISKKVTRIYYVLSGTGYFTIKNERYDVRENMVVEIPPKVEYSYSGNMQLIIFSTPRWFRGNDRSTRWNPDVNNGVPTHEVDGRLAATLAFLGLKEKSLGRAFLRLKHLLWDTF
jgi:mannose-6-phosphate isomerase-like protein (cupin superfamily)